MTNAQAMIRFIMEDLMDFRRRLPYAEMLEEIGCHKAAARQREFVTMCENAKKIEEWSGMFRITTQNDKILLIKKKDANVNPMNTGSSLMNKQKHASRVKKTSRMKIHKRNVYRQHRARSATVQKAVTFSY